MPADSAAVTSPEPKRVTLDTALIPLGELANATSIGSLFAFALVNVGVILLRINRPDLPRAFKTPLFPLIPVLGIGFCGYLMLQLEARTWIAFAVWSALGLVVYFVYGYQHSRLRQDVDLAKDAR